MKKVIIRKDMIRKAIVNAVPNAVEGVDFIIGKKNVQVIPPAVDQYDDDDNLIAPTMKAVKEAVEEFAKMKGVGIKYLSWGNGTDELTLDPEWEQPMGEFGDKGSRYHY